MINRDIIDKSSLIDLQSEDAEYLKQLGCLRMTSTGKFTMELNPSSEKCKKLIDDCPDFLYTRENLESVNIGLEENYSSSYNTFIENIYRQAWIKDLPSQDTLLQGASEQDASLQDTSEQDAPLQDLYISSLTKIMVSLHERYNQSILNLCSITSSKVYLTKIQLTSLQFKWMLESGWNIKTFEMMGCKIADLPKDFTLDDRLEYQIEKLKLRGALSRKSVRILCKEIKRNKSLIWNLKDITISKPLEVIIKKHLHSTPIKIHIDNYNT